MAEKLKNTTTKRFGTRYGATLKRRTEKIERIQRAEQRCPQCNKVSAKWMSFGIFECRKCGAKFTGEAWGTRGKAMVSETAIEDTETKEEEE